jgi:hypothetical protein
MYDGEVIRIEEDFLGLSVFVCHGYHDGQGGQLCTIYGHTNPVKGVRAGKGFGQGEIIATLTEVERSTTNVFTHLHLTAAWVSKAFPLDELNWKTLNDPHIATLLDPLRAMNCRHTVLDPEGKPK